ncbi:hypothetical protein R6Q57_001460 [Mikania cordata]
MQVRMKGGSAIIEVCRPGGSLVMRFGQRWVCHKGSATLCRSQVLPTSPPSRPATVHYFFLGSKLVPGYMKGKISMLEIFTYSDFAGDVESRKSTSGYASYGKKPRLSVFCSGKQLYAMLVDDQNKTCLFYGSTLQQSVRSTPGCTTIEAAQRVGEELVKTCLDLGIDEISSYDRNGFSRGARMEAFEIALSGHGFLFR